ncbi:MAG: hypothetical protein N2A99_06545 [Carnobacterium alterfunditum]
MKLIVRKYYRVFDIACATEEIASKILEGWEHKESMSIVYLVTDANETPDDEINLLDNDYSHFSSIDDAASHLIEEGAYSSLEALYLDAIFFE